MTDGVERHGVVVKLLNYEGVNTMYKVRWDDGEEQLFRLIYDYLKGELWFEETVNDNMA